MTTMVQRLRGLFRDVRSDASLPIGARGVLTLATRGAEGPGEVQVELNGAATTFIAYSQEPLERGTQVVVYDVLGARKVNVERIG
jgi:membrane protein implicated in regulation of membrane protease activity